MDKILSVARADWALLPYQGLTARNMDLEIAIAIGTALFAALVLVAWRLVKVSNATALAVKQIRALAEEVERLRMHDRSRLVAPNSDGTEQSARVIEALEAARDRLIESEATLAEELRQARQTVSSFEVMKAQRDGLLEIQKNLEEERDRLAHGRKELEEELRDARRDADRSRQDHLSFVEGLTVGRMHAAQTSTDRPDVRGPTDGAQGERMRFDFEDPVSDRPTTRGLSAGEARPRALAPPPVDTPKDEDHKTASLVARVMVSDLFLYNNQLIDSGLRDGDLREQLAKEYDGTRRTYQTRIAKNIWSQRHYLDEAFNARLQQEIDDYGASAKTKTKNATTKNVDTDVPTPPDNIEHRGARRVARVMVSDLFLYNPKLVERGLRDENLPELLADQFAEARKLFRQRVKASVWNKWDYLEMEFDRVLKKKSDKLRA